MARHLSRQPTLYLLDTNTVAYIFDGRSPAASARLRRVEHEASIAISAITAAELFYGLAKKVSAVKYRAGVEEFLATVAILNWDADVAQAYGILRARMEASGKNLSSMDMLIAAHAIAVNAILVTREKAFQHVEALRPVVNWATDLN